MSAHPSPVRTSSRRHRAATVAALLGLLLVVTVAPSAVAGGSDEHGRRGHDHGAAAVLAWNAVATDALAIDAAFGPPTFGVGIAYVQAAVYNAVVGIEGEYAPYQWDGQAPHDASVDAAVAAAAHDVLVAKFPVTKARADGAYTMALGLIPDGPSKAAGVAFGQLAAAHLLALRATDGWGASMPFTQPAAPGVWRPTPPAMAPYAAPWLGGMTPFLLSAHDQFRPGPPRALDSAGYAADLNEVESVGSASSTTRTAEQTSIAHLYGDNVYGVQLQSAFRDHLSKRPTDAATAARYLAAADLAEADAIIASWDAKFVYGSWRPITAIQQADTDGNAATVADPTWTPLIVTPPHPDYLSGHTTVSGAVTQMLTDLLGTSRIRLTIPSFANPADSRYYERASQLNSESIGSRIWAGIHTRTADEVGNAVGKQIGAWGAAHYFQPVDD